MKIADVILVGVACFLVTVLTWTVLDVAEAIRQGIRTPEKFYTVQTADAVYRDLTKCRNYGTWANYTTVDGKTITFNGTFTEIEQ